MDVLLEELFFAESPLVVDFFDVCALLEVVVVAVSFLVVQEVKNAMPARSATVEIIDRFIVWRGWLTNERECRSQCAGARTICQPGSGQKRSTAPVQPLASDSRVGEFLCVKVALLIGCLSVAAATTMHAQGGQSVRVYETEIQRTAKLRYLLFLPGGYNADPDRRWPVILYLHGGSVRGHDPDRIRTMGLPKRLEGDRDFPFIVISPLSPEGEIWTDTESIRALLDHVQLEHRVDPDAVYATGHSMGGRGVLYTAFKMPDRFAAVVAMSPVSPITAWASELRNVPLWIIHGQKDAVAPVKETEELVHAIESAGGKVRFSRLDDRDHFILDQYEGSAIIEWLNAQRRP